MTTDALDQDLYSIMEDLEKAAQTPEGALRANFLARDVNELAKLWDSADTRPQADAMLDAWSQMDGLKKRIASHWIERAKSIVESGVAPAAGADPKAIKEKKVHPVLARFRAMQVTTKGVAA